MSWCRCLLVRSLAGLSVRVAPCVQAARLAATASWNPRSRGTEHARACRAGGSRSLASAARRARTPQAKRVRGRRQAGGVPRYTRSVATPLSAAAADGAAAGAPGAAAAPAGPPAREAASCFNCGSYGHALKARGAPPRPAPLGPARPPPGRRRPDPGRRLSAA
jgi:hypothetical protein